MQTGKDWLENLERWLVYFNSGDESLEALSGFLELNGAQIVRIRCETGIELSDLMLNGSEIVDDFA